MEIDAEEDKEWALEHSNIGGCGEEDASAKKTEKEGPMLQKECTSTCGILEARWRAMYWGRQTYWLCEILLITKIRAENWPLDLATWMSIGTLTKIVSLNCWGKHLLGMGERENMRRETGDREERQLCWRVSLQRGAGQAVSIWEEVGWWEFFFIMIVRSCNVKVVCWRKLSRRE